jgi:hypothetical protein
MKLILMELIRLHQKKNNSSSYIFFLSKLKPY